MGSSNTQDKPSYEAGQKVGAMVNDVKANAQDAQQVMVENWASSNCNE